MQAAGRRRSAAEATKNGVVAGSVWESRMKIDEGKGGIKVFNGADRREDKGSIVPGGFRVYRRLKRNQSDTAVSESRRKWKSDAEKSPIQLRKTRSEPRHVPSPTTPKAAAAAASDESCRELEVTEEKKKIVVESLSNAPPPPAPSEKLAIDSGDNADVDEEDGDYYEEEEMEIDKEKFDVKEMNAKEKNLPLGEGEKKLPPIYEKQTECVNVKKDPPPVAERLAFDPHALKHPSNGFPNSFSGGIPNSFDVGIQETQNRVQNIVDLVMWRDISRSALIFGLGTFILLSSSFTKDMNFSLISAISYMGLLYLALIFLYKSIICRGAVEFEESDEKYMVVGEEEAIWVLRMILPYFNALLFKIRGLFSGDPAMTMKLAILLFVLARCGSSITIWTMGRLAFFGVFTVPKLCSAYSGHLARYGEFWIRRFQDAWDSCTHKKAVAAAIFTVIWNLSSVVARVWAVFMLVVAVRYYQQSLLIREEWIEEEAREDADGGGQGLTHRDVPTCDVAKDKKGS